LRHMIVKPIYLLYIFDRVFRHGLSVVVGGRD